MKLPACILALLMFSLTAQPLLVECQAKSMQAAKTNCCGSGYQQKKSKHATKKKSCHSSKSKECDSTSGCNPFASCSQSQYVAGSKHYCNNFAIVLKKKRYASSHENLVTGYHVDCWQPPELMSA